jgi:hypothetical protein
MLRQTCDALAKCFERQRNHVPGLHDAG